MSLEIVADNLEDVIENFELAGLKADSKFYVDIDRARNGDNRASVRQRIIKELQRCALRNKRDEKERIYKKLLFVGHKASGKTTELHRIKEGLKDDYETIFVANIERQQDRLAEQPDFIYYIVESLIRFCIDNPSFGKEAEAEVKELQRYLKERIFGEMIESTETLFGSEFEAEAGAEAGFPFSLLKIFSKLSVKETLAEEQKRQLNIRIHNNIDDFMEIANAILDRMQIEARRNGKMLLLILDGLDKVSEPVAEKIFLSTQSFLTKLNCSMIVTFPLYLNYSPKKDQAVAPFDASPFVLSVVTVHERNGKPCESGVNALRSIMEKRMLVDELFENPEDVQQLILNSGGNLRDLFTFIRDAAINADIFDREKIATSDLEITYQSKRSDLSRQLVKSYINVMNQVYWDVEKDSIIAENPEDNTLLVMFNAGLLIEYNGKRWVDLHPLVKQLILERRENGTWQE